MKIKTFEEIVIPELSSGAIINNRHPGFKEDYLVLHCLIRKYKPNSLFEIGTNGGFGTKIIKNAIGEGKVFSLDLPEEEFHKYQSHPERIGQECDLPYEQLYGDSLAFDYSKYPCEAYFVDGAHDFGHVRFETNEILKLKPGLIIFHDADIHEVSRAIKTALWFEFNYEPVQVENTRIIYVVKII